MTATHDTSTQETSDPDTARPTNDNPSGAGATIETGTARTNDVETYYERRGDGPPIVFIHGTFMSTTYSEAQMVALGDEFTTVAYDVRGHGRTGGSDRGSYDVELYATDLDALLASLGIENPILCGFSMGGCIAQVYAARHPEEVAGLVLADTFTAAPLPLKGRLLFANLRFVGLLDRFVRYTTLNRIQLWVGNRLAPGVAGDGVTVQRLIEEAPTIPHAEVRKIARSVAGFPESDFDASQVVAPTLVLYGEHAPEVFRGAHARLAEHLENADVEVAVVPGGGHASHIDNPEFFTDAVREFARSVGERD